MDNQHIYFGTVNQAIWNLKDERTHPLGQISIRVISEEEIVESSFDNQSVYLTVMNAPLKNFEIMDYEGNVLLNLQTYLDQGYVIQAETAGKFALAKRAKEENLDAIHDTVHEMARDEARHGKAFQGLLERYFGK